MEEALFDKIADAELQSLERALGEMDPDELEVEMSAGVLTLTLASGERIVVNSHRAAGQIWMAGFRTAWHFSPKVEEDGYRWRTATEELHAALARIIGEKLGRTIAI